MTDRLKIGQEVLIHGYVDEIRKDTIIIQNDGGYFGTVEYEVTDIENTNDVLDKIRDEIGQEHTRLSATRADETLELGECLGLRIALKIIDKYKK